MTGRWPLSSIRSRRAAWPWVLAGAVATVIFAENFFDRSVEELFLRHPGLDKVLHLLQYAVVFGLLYGLTRLAGSRRPRATALAGAAAIALADELVQQLVGRQIDGRDLVADALGIAGAAALTLPAARLRAGLAAAALVGAVAVVYESWLRTHDFAQAVLAERTRDYPEARRAYRRALAAGLRSPGLYNGLGWTEIESGEGDPAAAIAFAEEALRQRPSDPDYMDTLAWALHHGGRSAEALTLLEQAYARKPSMYCIHYHLGVVLQALGRPAEARAHFERQVAGWPGSLESRRAAHELGQAVAATTGRE